METIYSFVRKDLVSEQPPPLTQVGITGWLWRNLFSSMSNFTTVTSSVQSILMIIHLTYLKPYSYLALNSFYKMP